MYLFDYIEKQNGKRYWSRPTAYLAAVERGDIKKIEEEKVKPSTESYRYLRPTFWYNQP